MSTTSRIILALFSTVVIAAVSAGEELATNIYFERCNNAHKNTRCFDTENGPEMRQCRNKNNTHFYCTSTSPIHVAIGRVNSTRQHHPSPKAINITSTASSNNDNYSYCIEIAAKASSNYSVQCRMKETNVKEPKWIPFNDNNWESGNTPLPDVNVTMTEFKTFCNSAKLYPGPNLLPCDTWHMCASELANQEFHKKYISIILVDLSTILNRTTLSCPKFGNLSSILQTGRTQKYNKSGLLTFQYGQFSRFLLPYNPSSWPSNDSRYDDSFVAFKLKSSRDRDQFFIECQSSVLHGCGLQLVTKNLRIQNTSEDCHRHLMTVEHIRGLNGTITCSAFNEFKRTWDSKTEYLPNDIANTLTSTNPTVTPNHGGHNANTSNESRPTETPNVGEAFTTTLENTDTTPPVDAPRDPESTPLILIVVGAVLGGIFLCFLILLPLLIYLYKTIHLERRRIRLTKEEICEFMEGMQKEKAKSKGIHNVFVLPYDRSLEVPKIAVDFETTILGSGAFGKVLKGRYKGQDVAIKTIDGTTLNADAFRSLLSELKIMSYLGKHEHVMELVGAITSNIKTGEVFLILEYCAHGSALSYIREHRKDFVSFLSDDKKAYKKTSWSELSSHHLVRWSYEVACGMEYVSSRNIYHGDLAARNILLTENLTVKVGDFGLSRQLDLEKYGCYIQKKECPLPLKWMAIESLRDLKFSIQSDV